MVIYIYITHTIMYGSQAHSIYLTVFRPVSILNIKWYSILFYIFQKRVSIFSNFTRLEQAQVFYPFIEFFSGKFLLEISNCDIVNNKPKNINLLSFLGGLGIFFLLWYKNTIKAWAIYRCVNRKWILFW